MVLTEARFVKSFVTGVDDIVVVEVGENVVKIHTIGDVRSLGVVSDFAITWGIDGSKWYCRKRMATSL